MDKVVIALCAKVVADPGYGYTLSATEMNWIGYTPDTPGWPCYEGIMRAAMDRLREAGIDPCNRLMVLEARNG